MDDQEPTAWEEINPMTVSVRPAEPPCVFSERLQPASQDQFRDELEACLALVVPVGMDENARAEWLAVAWATVGHLPADLLKLGCQKAREVADHPSKIVPAILGETSEVMARRRELRPDAAFRIPGPPPKRDPMNYRGHPMSDEETAELNRKLESLGATARYRSDGSRYTLPHTTTGAG